MLSIRKTACGIALGALVTAWVHQRQCSGGKVLRFGYDQPHTTAYGIAGDIFDAKLKELSKGTMCIDQFPGAQLGQEPVMLQKIRTGDIDFCHHLDCQRRDGGAAGRRVLGALPVPRSRSSREGACRSGGVRRNSSE